MNEKTPLGVVWTEHAVKVCDLKPFERNPRKISDSAYKSLVDSLQTMGYHQRILATKDLRVIGGHQRILATKDLRVIGGHQRIRALKEVGIEEIIVLQPDRDLSDDEFKRLLIQDNLPFGEFDFAMLREDFTLEQLVDWSMPLDFFPDRKEDADAHWNDMPEFKQGDLMPMRTVKVHFRNDEDIKAFAELIKQQITDKTRFVWFPEAQKETLANKAYVNESSIPALHSLEGQSADAPDSSST